MADIHCDGNPCSVQKPATLNSNLLLQAGWTQKHLKKEWILTSISIYITFVSRGTRTRGMVMTIEI